MAHGDKAKAKSAKSGGKETGSKAGQTLKTGTRKAGKERTNPPGASGKSRPSKNARESAARAPRDEVIEGDGFTNAAIGDAFRLVIKKYPNALRRLTD